MDMHTLKLRTLTAIAAVLCIVLTIKAQESERKVKVNITTKENGKTETIKKEFTLEDGQDLNEILREMGVLQEVNDMEGGQTMEINVIKKEDLEVLEDMEIGMFMEKFAHCGEPKPFLGVYVESSSDDEVKGAYVNSIIDGTAAAESELKEGDVITAINGTAVSDHESLVDALYENAPGDEVKIAYLRDGKKHTTKVALGEKKRENSFTWNMDNEMLERLSNLEELKSLEELKELEVLKDMDFDFDVDFDMDEDHFFFEEDDGGSRAFLGVTNHSERTEKLAHGVAIETVVANSTAEKMGLQAGDVIMAINGQVTDDFGTLADILDGIEVGTATTVEFMRDGQPMSATDEIGERKKKARSFIFAPGEMDDVHFEFKSDFEGSEEEMEAHQEQLQEEIQRIMERVERMRENGADVITKEVTVVIELDDISPEEAERINANSSEKVRIENDLAVEDFNYYPNPNQGVFDLSFTVPETGDTDIAIFDQNGSKIYSEKLMGLTGSYNNQIDISDQARGTYFMQISQNGKTYSKKIVKN